MAPGVAICNCPSKLIQKTRRLYGSEALKKHKFKTHARAEKTHKGDDIPIMPEYTQLNVKAAFALDSLSASFFYMLLRRDKPSGTTIITPWYPNSVSLGHAKQESEANM